MFKLSFTQRHGPEGKPGPRIVYFSEIMTFCVLQAGGVKDLGVDRVKILGGIGQSWHSLGSQLSLNQHHGPEVIYCLQVFGDYDDAFLFGMWPTVTEVTGKTVIPDLK